MGNKSGNANNSSDDKVKISNLSERDAYYEYWWSKGHMCSRRTAWVNADMYAKFKKATKFNSARKGFLGSG